MNRAVLLTGTPVCEAAPRLLRAGKLQASFDAGGLRHISWNGVEVLRALMFLVRTPGWGTPAPLITGLEVQEQDQAFWLTYRAHYGPEGAGVTVGISLTGRASGQLRAEAEILAEVPFETNRTGFVILHPLDGFAGTEVRVEHASAAARDLTIAAQISPGQPVMDMRAISHRPVPGLTVETRFEGDVFEMEDHRNWSDASFKTYSRPIGLPYPYLLDPAEPVTQAVEVSLHDEGCAASAAAPLAPPALSGQRMPDYALPLDRLADASAALGFAQALGALAPQWLLLRYDTTFEAQPADFAPLAALLAQTGAGLELQVILGAQDEAGAEAALLALGAELAAAGITVGRVSAFAKCDEQSFQPGEARPPHPAETALAAALAQAFPGALRIGGSPAFFTEFNRKRPDPGLWQGLSFATTPLVHAADDLSVMESLQSLPHIMASAQALAAGLPLAVGPTGIGARINPYGPGPAQNDPDAREGMAARDPRQRGLFAAAWTLGYLTRIAPFAPERFAFGGATGAFGLISSRQDYPRAYWDDLAEGALYPLYHLAQILAQAAGGVVETARTEAGLAQLVWRKEGRRFALIANLAAEAQALPDCGLVTPAIAVLDAGHLPALAAHAQGLALGAARPEGGPPAMLDAYGVVYLEEQDVTL